MIINRRSVLATLAASSRGALSRGRRTKLIRRARSTSSCHTRRAAQPTWWRASSRTPRGQARPDHCGRQPAGRRRGNGRRACRGQRRPRRLHAASQPGRIADHRAVALQARLRSAQGFRADRHRRLEPGNPHRPSIAPGQVGPGVYRLREEQSRQDQFWFAGRGHAAASVGSAISARRRHQAHRTCPIAARVRRSSICSAVRCRS